MKTAWVLRAGSRLTAYNVASLQAALERKNFSVSSIDLYDLRADSENQIRHYHTHEVYTPPDLMIFANGIRIPITNYDSIMESGATCIPLFPSYEHEHHLQKDTSLYNLYKSLQAYKCVKIIESWPSFKPHSLTKHIMASSKDYAFRMFKNNNVPTARTIELSADVNDEVVKSTVKTEVGEPLVVKSANGLNGEGTEYCASVDELAEACTLVNATKLGGKLLAQEYIGHSVGMVLTVGIAGDQIFPIARVGTGGFKSDTQEGRIQIAFKKTKKLQDLTIAARKALGLEYLRFDMMIDENGEYKIIEANAPGGMNIVSCTHNQEFAAVIVDHTLKLYEDSHAT